MEQTTIMIAIVAGVFFILLSVYSMITTGSRNDDQQRLNRLRQEASERFSVFDYKTMLMHLRHDRFQKLKFSVANTSTVAEWMEDYLVLNDEIQRVEQDENQFGGEFMPYAERKDTLV
ncbi:MAG: hypothetical protein AB1728_14115 [Bacteroidota bacterium]